MFEDPIDSQAIVDMALMGIAFQLSSGVELAIEIVIMKELGITLAQNCAVCGPLGGGAKVALVNALCAMSGNYPNLRQAISEFQSAIGRNALAHGFVSFEKPEKPWFLVHREVKTKLEVKIKKLDSHFSQDLPRLQRAVFDAASVSDQDAHDYGLAIARLSPTLNPQNGADPQGQTG
jgi:hypothetical protein